MSYFSLIYLGIFSLIISVLSFFNIIYSYYFNLYLNLNTYYVSLIDFSNNYYNNNELNSRLISDIENIIASMWKIYKK